MRTRILFAALLVTAGCSGAGGPAPSAASQPAAHPAGALLGAGLVPPPLTAPEDLGGLLPDPAADALGEDLLPPS